jgi:chromosomal replication initiation ATPase DnaA
MTPRERTLADIGLIALRHGLTRQDIMGRSKARHISIARQHCYWHFRQKDMSYPQIARAMGLADHTTVIHGVKMHIARNSFALAGYSEGLI